MTNYIELLSHKIGATVKTEAFRGNVRLIVPAESSFACMKVLKEEGFDMQNEVVQLILSSAHEAVNRLQFYRQAYGRVGETGEAGLAEKKKISTDFFSATKVRLDWPDSHTDASGVAVSQKMSRLLMN